MGMPKFSVIVRMSSGAPPCSMAMLMRRDVPVPGIGAKMSRGIDSSAARCDAGSMRRIMIVSECRTGPRPMRTGSPPGRSAALSTPTIR